jgi:ubiquinone/menaquinone biosynthesis C-methylase UbiE
LLVKYITKSRLAGFIFQKNSPMIEILQYNDDASNKLLDMYRTPDVQAQRREFLQFVKSDPGKRVLDVGSGPGFLTSAMADAVGHSGWVCGIDISDLMLDLAKTHCAHQPWVEFHKAEATRLPFPEQHFDVVVSMQVLEYVIDICTALSEFHRVLRPGGQVVIMDTDWDSLVWYSATPERANRILAEWSSHVAYPYLPRTLTQQLLEGGFQVERSHIIPIFNPNYDANNFSNRLIDLIVPFVSKRGNIPPGEAEAWAQELRRSGEGGQYFFSLNRYVFSASKR